MSRSRPLSLEIVGTDISRLAMWALPFGSGVVGGKLRTRAVEVEWFGDLVFGEILCFGGTRVRCRVLESCCRNSKKSVCRCKDCGQSQARAHCAGQSECDNPCTCISTFFRIFRMLEDLSWVAPRPTMVELCPQA